MKEYKCNNCGAPLSPVPGMNQCKCNYCRQMNPIIWEEDLAEDIKLYHTESKEQEPKISENLHAEAEKKVMSAKPEKQAASTVVEKQVTSTALEKQDVETSVGSKKKSAGAGTSILRMYLVIMIVALTLVSIALNSASVMADEGNDLRTVPAAASRLEGKEWMDVVQYFRDCGFEEIETMEEEDLFFDLFHKAGKVDEVSISGCKNFEKDATFYKDARVIIYYHSMK
ncbi:MAG: hypothetical protein MJ097_02650 [Dorea sp.]|nr:hypothetical protein [Dorea sp.]